MMEILDWSRERMSSKSVREMMNTKISVVSAKPPKVNLRAPNIAWPTLLLFGACLGIWLIVSIGLVQGWVSYGWGMCINAIAAFVAFTPMHDASHRSIARAKWVNEAIGRVCAIILLAPFPAFRYVHLEHHKHTNDDHKDPDKWSGLGPTWLLPFRWLTQDLHYYVVYLSSWNERKPKERWETLLSLLVIWPTLVTLCWMGYTLPVVFGWMIPSRFAIAFLAYSFDYLPHKPHHITSAEDRFKATLVRPSMLLTPVFLYQNFHLIHHLYPGVPFYRYAEIWRKQKDYLLAKGVEMRSLTGQVIPSEQVHEASTLEQ